MDVFAVTVKAQIYLMAENEIEAENLAASMTETASDEMPGNVILECYAYRTPNQSNQMKHRALNNVPNVELTGAARLYRAASSD